MNGEGMELLLTLTPEQRFELITNTEVTCLILHTKPWKYYALCNIPYRALKMRKQGGGRYEWIDVTARSFEDRVIRLRKDWESILSAPAADTPSAVLTHPLRCGDE